MEDQLLSFKLKCNELLEAVTSLSGLQKEAGQKLWKEVALLVDKAFDADQDSNNIETLQIDSVQTQLSQTKNQMLLDSIEEDEKHIEDAERELKSDTECVGTDVDTNNDTSLEAIEEEIELAKPKSNLPAIPEEAGTPNTNDDASDFGSLLSFLPQLSPMVKVDGKDCIVTDKDGCLHIQIEKTDGTVQSLKLTAREANGESGNEQEEKVGGGKQLNLIRKQLDSIGKENEPFDLQSQSDSDKGTSEDQKRNTGKRGRKPRPEEKMIGDRVISETGEVGYMCRECKTIYKTYSNLEVHMRTHTGEKPFSCDVCHKSFVTKGNMEKHRQVHSDFRPYQCDVCHSSYKDKKTLTVHMRTHTGEKPYGCDVCGRKFTQSVTLQTHIKIHRGEKTHLCDSCGKSFRTKAQLHIHQKRHYNVKNYKCSKCEFSSVCKGDLDRHMNRHAQRKPFLCSVCPKTFTRSQYLKEHMNVHLDKKPFSCKICQEAFCDQGSLYRHRRKHKDEMDAMVNKGSVSAEVSSTSVTGSQDLQVVISGDTVEQGLQNLQTIIVSAGTSHEMDVDSGAIEYLETDMGTGETEVYRITCVNTEDLTGTEPVVVDFSAMNMLANATAKQFTLQ